VRLVFCGVHDKAEAELTPANAIPTATMADTNAIFRVAAPFVAG
jgi:hypothetical protein